MTTSTTSNHLTTWQAGEETRMSPACANNDHRCCQYTANECDCEHHFEQGYQTAKERNDNDHREQG